MQFSFVSWRRIVAVACLVALAVTGSVSGAVAHSAGEGILPPPDKTYGRTYAEWSAEWWQWAFSLPADKNPFFDENGSCANGANGQSGPVWFLTGVLNQTGTAVRNCKVPANKALFFPLINVECSTLEAEPFFGSNEEELRACAEKFEFGAVFAEIDGVPVTNLDQYLVESPMFKFKVPMNDVLGVGPAKGQSVSRGYYLMLGRLSPGQHTLHFGGTFTDFDFSLDITYNLTVAK